MGGPKQPKPSAQELELQQQQAQLLQQQRQALEEQQRLQNLLQPIGLQQAGLRPVYGDVQVETERQAPPGQLWLRDPGEPETWQWRMHDFANPDAGGDFERVPGRPSSGEYILVEDTKFNRDRGALRAIPTTLTENRITGYEDAFADERAAQLARQMELESKNLSLLDQQIAANAQLAEFQKQQFAQAQESQRLEDLLQPELLRQAGYELQLDASGNPIGVALTQDLLRQREIERGMNERTLAALRGELPVDPALLRDLEREEGTLRESLLKQLGTGYETSSAGIETLGQFAQRRQSILEGARRGDLSLAEQLSLARGEDRRADTGALFGTLRGAFPVTGGGGAPDGSFSGGSSQQRLNQLVSALRGGGSPATFGEIFSGSHALQQQLAAQRDARYRGALGVQAARTQMGQTIGSGAGALIGGALAGYLTGGSGTLVGAQVGAAAGGAAGTGLANL